MTLVLGIDAAWTVRNPSGIALVSTETVPPKLVRASPSFEDFVAGTTSDAWCGKHEFRASLTEVIRMAERIGTGPVSVMAVDMPIARSQVRRRRASDNMISRTFGRYDCSTYTPSEQRPGKVSDDFVTEAEVAGFSLQTTTVREGERALLEVYPHVALLSLFRGSDGTLPQKLKYKLAKRSKHWRDLDREGRLSALLEVWRSIIRRLRTQIDFTLELDCYGQPMCRWKAWEDVIDAIVCCWVGLKWLRGQAAPYGDNESAIWFPVDAPTRKGA